MTRRRFSGSAAYGVAALISGACGGAPTTPMTLPPQATCASLGNQPPTIDSIVMQGSRTGQPANFADLGESIAISATVRDEETPVDRLQYTWSATAGTFDGTGRSVTWRAPATATTPLEVTVTLHAVESCGTGQAPPQHDVAGTARLSLHNSAKEVGDMASLFLNEFSDSSLRDVDRIMRNFSRAACPNPGAIDSEFDDVRNNRANFQIVEGRISPPVVVLAFGGRCPFPDPARRQAGDACAIVPAYWDAIYLPDKTRGTVDGTDYLAAAYSAGERRWWLCSSDYDVRSGTGIARTGFIR